MKHALFNKYDSNFNVMSCTIFEYSVLLLMCWLVMLLMMLDLFPLCFQLDWLFLAQFQEFRVVCEPKIFYKLCLSDLCECFLFFFAVPRTLAVVEGKLHFSDSPGCFSEALRLILLI
jgi:hypothetical protein